MYVNSINLTEFWSYRIVLLVNLFGLFCCVQVEYPVYWTYSEWTEGFKRLLDFLHLDEVSTKPNIKKTCSIRLWGSCFYQLLLSVSLECLNFKVKSTLLTRADPHWFPSFYRNQSAFSQNVFLIIIEFSKFKSGKWSGQMFSFSNFRALDAPSMNQKPGKGNFRELKSKKMPRGVCPQGPLEACSLGPLFRKSVSIYPRSTPDYLGW